MIYKQNLMNIQDQYLLIFLVLTLIVKKIGQFKRIQQTNRLFLPLTCFQTINHY